MEEEFPRSAHFLEVVYPDGQPTIDHRVLYDLVRSPGTYPHSKCDSVRRPGLAHPLCATLHYRKRSTALPFFTEAHR